MEIKFKGRYERAMFFKAVRLANFPDTRQKWIRPVLLMMAGAAIILLFIRIMESGDIIGNGSYIALVMIATAFIIRPYLSLLQVARKLWANPALQEELSGNINQKAITYVLKAESNEMPWSRFARTRKNRNLVTLVTRDGLLLVFPRKFFASGEDWSKFNQLVEEKIRKYKRT